MSRAAGKSKGELTAERLLDAAEIVFAERGYDGASLREIARRSDIREPGIYNHFSGKQSLYTAVIDRALTPMLTAMQESMAKSNVATAYAELPGIMTDRLAEHPQMAALFHQTLQNDAESVGSKLMADWLDRLFEKGMETLDSAEAKGMDRHELAIRVIALFNLTTGYFLSQRVFSSLVPEEDDLTNPENIARQKRFLEKIVRSALSE